MNINPANLHIYSYFFRHFSDRHIPNILDVLDAIGMIAENTVDDFGYLSLIRIISHPSAFDLMMYITSISGLYDRASCGSYR